METPYFTIDISGVEPQESDKVIPGGIRTIVRVELEKSAVTRDIRLRAIIRDPQNLHRYRLLFNTDEEVELAQASIHWPHCT